MTIALLVAARDTGSDAAAWAAGVLLVPLAVLVAWLLGRTTLGMARRQFCGPE